MLFLLKPAMLKSIEDHVNKAKQRGHILDVYKTAEEIRLEHIGDNVAREDIIEKLIFFAGSMALEFNARSSEAEAFAPIRLNGSHTPLASEGVQ
jgi:hypothetical protein